MAMPSPKAPLGTDEGLPTECIATFDTVTVFPRAMLVQHRGPSRWLEEIGEAEAASFDDPVTIRLEPRPGELRAWDYADEF
jgi:hypothetical protein